MYAHFNNSTGHHPLYQQKPTQSQFKARQALLLYQAGRSVILPRPQLLLIKEPRQVLPRLHQPTQLRLMGFVVAKEERPAKEVPLETAVAQTVPAGMMLTTAVRVANLNGDIVRL